MPREYKRCEFKADHYDDELGIFEGYASVFGNIDSGEDIVEHGAFTDTIQTDFHRMKILSGHNSEQLPIGKPLELREDAHGLFLKAQLSDTQMGRDVKALLRDGVLNELSIGFDADPADCRVDEHGVRHLYKIKLWEVSVVTWAMNSRAVITDYKAQTSESDTKKADTLAFDIESITPIVDELITKKLAQVMESKHTPHPPQAKLSVPQASRAAYKRVYGMFTRYKSLDESAITVMIPVKKNDNRQNIDI
ncbi:hypothetical protein FACS1894184_14720 [Clostridia bacterium]|nr:hypothetical protein FACS1894184_14720 [Clostridia bacterium]